MKSLTQYIKEEKETTVPTINGFVILKPEFLHHKDEWEKMLTNNGWKIVQQKRFQMTHETAEKLYSPHKDKDFYKDLCDYMSSGDCICCTCSKDCSDPIKEMNEIKDKIRNAWGKDEMKNAMHSSDSLSNVDRESKIVFNEQYENTQN